MQSSQVRPVLHDGGNGQIKKFTERHAAPNGCVLCHVYYDLLKRSDAVSFISLKIQVREQVCGVSLSTPSPRMWTIATPSGEYEIAGPGSAMVGKAVGVGWTPGRR